MALPIEPSPRLSGADAEKLLASLDTGATEAEMCKREREARRFVEALSSAEGLTVKLK